MIILDIGQRHRYNPIDDEIGRDWGLTFVYIIAVFIVLIIAYIYDKNQEYKNRKFREFRDSLDEEGQEIHSELNDIHNKYETAVYSFTQNIKHSRNSDSELRKTWCKNNIQDYKLCVSERNSAIAKMKEKYNEQKVNKVLIGFKWTYCQIDELNFNYSKGKGTLV